MGQDVCQGTCVGRSSGLFEGEIVSSGILEPWIVLWTFGTSVQSNGLAGQLSSGQGASIGQVAQRLALDFALLLPGGKVANVVHGSWLLHPLQHLGHGDKVNVVLVQHFVDPLHEGVQQFGVRLEPAGVEEYAHGRSVRLVVAVEVVVQEVIELVARDQVGTTVHHRATGQFFVEVGIIATVEFVHDHFPDGMRSGRTVLTISVALVRHAEVQSVRPQGRVAQWGGDGGIVQEGLLLHHEELIVAADSQVRGAHTHDRVVGNVGEPFDDESNAGHLFGPRLGAGLAPVLFIGIVTARMHVSAINLLEWMVLRDRVSGDFVALSVHFLHCRVVGVLVRNEEGSLDSAPVRIVATVLEQLLQNVDVVVVDGIVERDHDHLRHLAGLQFAGNLSSIGRAEAVGQNALALVTNGGPIGILVDGYREELRLWINDGSSNVFHLLQAFSSEPSAQSGVPLQNSSLLMQSPLPHANLPVSQIGSSVARRGETSLGSAIKHQFNAFHFFKETNERTLQLLAVLHVGLPITGLLVDVEGQARWTAQCKQSLHGTSNHVSTIFVRSQTEVFTWRTAFAQFGIVSISTFRLSFDYCGSAHCE